MKAIAIIPARWGSTRFPGKSLALLGGQPLVQRVYERASKAQCLERVIIATDDERIRQVVEDFGGVAVMTAQEHVSGTDRVAEAMAGLTADVVVNVQGDEPFVEPALIENLVEAMVADKSWDMATAAVAIQDERELRDSSVVKVVWGEDGHALYFSRSPIPFDRDKTHGINSGVYWRHVGVYAYRADFLAKLVQVPPCAIEQAEKLEQLRALHLGARIKVLTTDYSARGVDTPEDLALAEELLGRTVNAGGRP